MYKSPQVTLKEVSYIGFRANTILPVQLSNITSLVRFSNITALLPPPHPPSPPPHPELIINRQETVRCIKECSDT
jgi:hypothetical protein